MGLKVWFPFLGNLDQQGCSNITATNLGAVTSNNNGKIGKCMSFNGSATGALRLPPVLNATDDFSICFWVKFNNLSVNHCLFSQRTAINDLGYTIFWIQGQTGIRLDAGGQSSGGYTRITDTSKWYHVVCCRDSSKKYIYINGELISSVTKTTVQTSNINSNYAIIGGSQNSSGGSTSDANYLNGYLNDYRIYDHCLSAAEVREISQGLVLHYKLDNNGHKNLFTSDADRGMTIASGNTSTYTAYTYIDPIIKDNNIFKEGTQYTITYDYVINSITSSTSVYVYSQLNAARCSPLIAQTWMRNGATGSGHVVETFTVTEEQANYSNTFRVRWRINGGTEGDSITLKNIRLYLGTAEEINYISDSSGYNHNGAVTGNLQINSNTSRYDSCIYSANGGSNYIQTPTLNMPTDAITLNIWFKSINKLPTADYHMIIDSVGNSSGRQHYEVAMYKTGYFRGGLFVNGTRYADNCSTTTGCNGNWHMLTLTYDGATIKRYFDGNMEKQTTVAITTGLQPTATLRLFKDGYSSYACIEASLSDFRIYATALDADVIRQLYEVGAKIDKEQNLHTFELNESNYGRELMAVPLTSAYNSDSIYSGYNDDGEITLTGKKSIGSPYIKINPQGKKYYFDIDVTIAASNHFYIGFQRYDATKTSRSNDATMYMVDIQPSAVQTHKHYHLVYDTAAIISNETSNFGYFNASTPVDTIRLRILNDWSSQNSRTATIHRLSVREVPSLQNSKINKRGQVVTDELIEMDSGCRIQKNGTIEANEIIEF